jgi:hypothetical protein
MQIQETTPENLTGNVRSRFKNLSPNARVFLAKSGGRIVGSAAVEHRTTSQGLRDLVVTLRGQSNKVKDELAETVRDATSHLKRHYEWR